MLPPMSVKKQFNTPIYNLQVSPVYGSSDAPFIKQVAKYEENHMKTGDCDYLLITKTYIDNKMVKLAENFPQQFNFKEILSYLKKVYLSSNNNKEINNLSNQFRSPAEYHADINPTLSDTALTNQEKITSLKNYGLLFEHLLTFEAQKEIEAQQHTHHFFNTLQEGFGVDEHDIPLSYHLTKQSTPTHPSTLSRYQLILRAIQLLSESEH